MTAPQANPTRDEIDAACQRIKARWSIRESRKRYANARGLTLAEFDESRRWYATRVTFSTPTPNGETVDDADAS